MVVVDVDIVHIQPLETVFQVKPAADYSDVTYTVIEAVSKDGTKVPVTVLYKKGLTPNGMRPTIVYGYGGFGIPTEPHFIGPYLVWLENVLAYLLLGFLTWYGLKTAVCLLMRISAEEENSVKAGTRQECLEINRMYLTICMQRRKQWLRLNGQIPNTLV